MALNFSNFICPPVPYPCARGPIIFGVLCLGIKEKYSENPRMDEGAMRRRESSKQFTLFLNASIQSPSFMLTKVDNPELILNNASALAAFREGIADAFENVTVDMVTIIGITQTSRRLPADSILGEEAQTIVRYEKARRKRGKAGKGI